MTEKQLKLRQQGLEASYLAACALHDVTPSVSENLDLEELYRFCKFHSITSIAAMAMEEVWKAQPAGEEIMKKWRLGRDKAIRKNILLNAERERILAYLESIGCWYMPLKGSLMQFEYPKFGMRQMSDNDILYDESRTQEVYDFMISCGYEAETFMQGNHEEYVKKPVYNMEMHRSLFRQSSNPEMAAYYDDVKSRLLPEEGKQYGYRFTDEDFYIFMVSHAYKHYLHGGVGIRNLLDVFVYNQNHGKHMNWEYLERELRSFGAWDFDVLCRRLSQLLFAAPERVSDTSQDDLDLLDVFFSAGTFGTVQRVVENRLKGIQEDNRKFGKLHYVLSRMFPTMEYMKEMHPALREKPWLAPFYYLKRFFSVFGERRKVIMNEIRNLLKIKK